MKLYILFLFSVLSSYLRNRMIESVPVVPIQASAHKYWLGTKIIFVLDYPSMSLYKVGFRIEW